MNQKPPLTLLFNEPIDDNHVLRLEGIAGIAPPGAARNNRSTWAYVRKSIAAVVQGNGDGEPIITSAATMDLNIENEERVREWIAEAIAKARADISQIQAVGAGPYAEKNADRWGGDLSVDIRTRIFQAVRMINLSQPEEVATDPASEESLPQPTDQAVGSRHPVPA